MIDLLYLFQFLLPVSLFKSKFILSLPVQLYLL